MCIKLDKQLREESSSIEWKEVAGVFFCFFCR